MKPAICRSGAAQQGFTLMELVVTLGIFALVSVMAYGGLRTVLDAQAMTAASAERLGQVQLAFTLMGRDLEQIAQRPARDGYGDFRPPLRFSGLREPPRLELIRAGARSGAGRSSLQRVAWEMEQGTLYRLYWSALDGGHEEPTGRMPLLSREDAAALRDWEVRFHYRDGASTAALDYWPPAGLDGGHASLPLAVEVILDLDGMGRVSRLFAVR
ncbi:type II secretion system minor pseudopilin GspJ [Ectothiorhodospira variabilis]|uniref:type II secretion system minor pseudopilin GspJ n=1 Tax=Ectothiorhodospira variabilis TaxID=505694 RepID=UPI001EFB4CFC|nr:type II secretion system minor pseudopilin GspJ [Ectothiorhodospira variabilis]MCG5494344.1 type II secretion system minor pseudopilin GspJ [Ectothiorhodospira variabilis]MCG5504111.1 type II secretion system minor pseudopilin GspJ [Ectothiorhodospira variabilis]MCG5507266.1 type II secretion system minor pseudopilin GspJ [Ectothiorhodospira variabilis]